MCTESESLFKTIVKSTTTTERRLMIIIEATRTAHGRQDISDVGLIRTDDTPADGLTKAVHSLDFERQLGSGLVEFPVKQRAARTPIISKTEL